MLHLRKRRLETVEHVRASLLGGIRLELATLPPYLTALYSIMPGTNVEAAKTLRSVAIEEMLHFCIACNLLNAVGGHPTINERGFTLDYPSELPMGIGDQPGRPFRVGLRRCSLRLIRGTFMVIESPEDPLLYLSKTPEKPKRGGHSYHTIGQFYLALEKRILELGNPIFTGDPSLQVTGWFPSGELFPVTDVDSASRAIRVIIEQGEGTRKTPIDPEGECAHYYRFAEIVHSQRLVVDPSLPNGYAYKGAPIPFDSAGVYPMVNNPGKVRLPRHSLVERYANQFDESYTALLNALHATVNGAPKQLDTAIGLMYTLRLQAQQLMATPIPGRRTNAGPRWKYLGPA